MLITRSMASLAVYDVDRGQVLVLDFVYVVTVRWKEILGFEAST